VARAHACILVVEDETAVRELLTAFLEDCGYTVITATDGRNGMRLFEERGDGIDLVITDVVMPHANGTSLGAAVHARRPGVPILYLSGYLHDGSGELPLDPLGTYLQKPVSRSTLLQRVHELLSPQTNR
jgi:DNA-binding response OmpR family regulator